MKSLSAKSVSSILSLVLGAAVCCCCAQDQDLFSNALGWDVADKFLVSRGGGNNNVVFAPTSVVSVLGMVFAGLGGQTRQAVGKDLGFPSSLSGGKFSEGLQNYGSRSGNLSRTNFVLLASKAKKDFGQVIKGTFGAELLEDAFNNGPEAVRKMVNQKVSRATEGKIRDILPGGSITDNTRAVFVNAIHLKSAWEEPFDKRDTGDEDFTDARGRTRKVATMFGRKSTAGVLELQDGTLLLDLPLAVANLSMVVAMPPQGKSNGLPALLRRLDNLSPIILDSASSLPTLLEELEVHLPKFSTSTRVRMSSPFSRWYKEVGKLFKPGADFSGMAKGPGAKTEYFLEEVHHMAVIDVNEGGVEAAGATAAGVGIRFGALPRVVKINRPFAYFIVGSGEVLFAGIVRNPAKTN